jgi:EAL and modified HD-GYP domain-containing signal transduction protein
MNIWVARQPIFDRKRNVYGYELLFRRNADSVSFDGTDARLASSQVLSNILLGTGLKADLSGRKAFVNFDRTLLMGGFNSLIPSNDLVVEVLEDVVADPEVVSACRNLREQGYTIALDDFVRGPQTEPLTEFAHIIKVDIRQTPREEQLHMLRKYQARGIAMLAEKVETGEEFSRALNDGYDYFQGYFFAKPTVVTGRQIAPFQASCLGLLCETQRAELAFDRLEAMIGSDVALSWQLLRYTNSALFYQTAGGVRSIGQALRILGEDRIRSWAALATLPVLAKGKPDELVKLALIRAHFCEYLARLAKLPNCAEAFLMGMFSLLDALLDLPLDQALSHANVASPIRSALLGEAPDRDLLQALHRLVAAWESADWAEVSEMARLCGIPLQAIGEICAESTRWAERAVQGTAHRKHSRRRSRQPIAGPLSLNLAEPGGTARLLDGIVLNISDEGLGVSCREPAPLNSKISFDAPGLRLGGTGRVRYCVSSGSENLIGIERDIP